MLPLVILGFPRLIYSISELAIAISYSRFFLLKNRFICWLNLYNLGFSRLNSADVLISSESLCNRWFNLVQLGLFLS